MSSRSIYILIAIIALLSLIGAFFLGRYSVKDPEVVFTSDTTKLTLVDTVMFPNPVVDYEVILEEVYIEVMNGDSIVLPVTQKYYSSPYYDIWVSGYKPRLDSARVFNKTEVVTINNENTKVIEKGYSWGLYANGGAWMIGKKVMPYVGLRLSTPSRWDFGANVGIIDNDITYSLNLGYKIF